MWVKQGKSEDIKSMGYIKKDGCVVITSLQDEGETNILLEVLENTVEVFSFLFSRGHRVIFTI